MSHRALLPILLVFSFVSSIAALNAQSGSDPVEVAVADLQATPIGVSIALQAPRSEDRIHMMIGLNEGEAIARALQHQKAPRPQTHDLLKLFLDRNGWRVQKVLIRDFADESFRADLTLEKAGATQTYDCRPSDALAVGLLYGAKIYVNPQLFEQERDREDPLEVPPPDSSIHL
jgi:bifunctional DNase/RNase